MRRRLSFSSHTHNEKERSNEKTHVPLRKQKQKSHSLTSLSSVLRKSKQMEKLRRHIRNYNIVRHDNFLTSNGLRRVEMNANGNCFIHALVPQVEEISSISDPIALRARVVEHRRDKRLHYRNFLTFPSDASDEEKDMTYSECLDDLKQNGHWNSDLADCVPLAIANTFQRIVHIYSSRISNPVCDITPVLLEKEKRPEKNA